MQHEETFKKLAFAQGQIRGWGGKTCFLCVVTWLWRISLVGERVIEGAGLGA